MTILKKKPGVLAVEHLKGKTLGEDLNDSVPGVIKRHKLPWSTLANQAPMFEMLRERIKSCSKGNSRL